eukprot:8469309-Pyramimonas_sp.AAC.1
MAQGLPVAAGVANQTTRHWANDWESTLWQKGAFVEAPRFPDPSAPESHLAPMVRIPREELDCYLRIAAHLVDRRA